MCVVVDDVVDVGSDTMVTKVCGDVTTLSLP